MITIAVDAMGGDLAPRVEVEGSVQAAREYGVRVLLVGREEVLAGELKRQGAAGLPIEIVHANEVITMDDHAAKSFRQKRDSSIRVAARLVRDGKAEGVVSAGNTGAVMATAKIVLGAIPGVDRPAIGTVFPNANGTGTLLLDAGANVDCKPHHLEQFAIMGECYYRALFRVERPRVGLLSIGSEAHKGNELTQGALPLLSRLPLNFVGNVEGRDLYNGSVDVIVCDGFIGNVALKVSEGLADMIKSLLKQALSSTASAKLGYMLSRNAFANFRNRIDYNEYGGAPLLGIRGVSVICHGSSPPKAVKNAIRVAKAVYEDGINDRIESELKALNGAPEATAEPGTGMSSEARS